MTTLSEQVLSPLHKQKHNPSRLVRETCHEKIYNHRNPPAPKKQANIPYYIRPKILLERLARTLSTYSRVHSSL